MTLFWKGYYTPFDITGMFPYFSYINSCCHDKKMHYLGRYEDSQYWAGSYKNGERKLVEINICGSLEFDIKLS